MIIATIGNSHLKLDNLQDAGALFGIVSRATLVEKSYDLNFRDFYFLSGEKLISVAVVETDTIHPFEYCLEVQNAREAKQTAAAQNAAEAA